MFSEYFLFTLLFMVDMKFILELQFMNIIQLIINELHFIKLLY